MSFSAYKWDARCNIQDNRAAFDEILSLKQLSAVKLRLDKVDSDELVLDAAWLKGLREFNIQISPRSRDDSNHQPTQHDEKRAILRGIDLMEMGKGLKGLLSTASSLDLVNCGGMNTVSELAVNNVEGHKVEGYGQVKEYLFKGTGLAACFGFD
ncbi:cc-nbs-lrr resistance protein [Corchorus olitorius]|uniref:Cc-nbs-lrr resistance protein n=1 Tax=Corchorus olitorius TaxID=93759 RepID=A0A1R3KBU4_9ROSI|nr:cc-nbs-lrr resistance protein [Corchorus olitorius]